MDDIRFWQDDTMNHPNLEFFLKNCKNNNLRSLYIIDKLINNFKFKIQEDTIKNDVRNLYLSSYIFGKIKMTTSFIFDKNSDKKEYIEINYNIYEYTYFANY